MPKVHGYRYVHRVIPLADTLQVGMSSTGYPGGNQVETLMDTANTSLGSQRSLDADTESGL